MQTEKPTVSNRRKYRYGVSELLAYNGVTTRKNQPELSSPATFNTYQFL
jgi:hypothetical protein